MFNIFELQSLVEHQSQSNVKHEVIDHSPSRFSIRPQIDADSGLFSITVHHSELRIRVAFEPDPMAGRLCSAIVSGVHVNPSQLRSLDLALQEHGWTPRLKAHDADLLLQADMFDLRLKSPHDVLRSCVKASLTLSDFVISQVAVKQVGKMRPASRRTLSSRDGIECWQYDPSELDKATQEHRDLENWLIDRLADENIAALDPISPPYFDLAWQLPSTHVICEVKTISRHPDKQLRLGIGQLLHYCAQLRSAQFPVQGALLVSGQPEDAVWGELCTELGIVLFWPTDTHEIPASLLPGNGPSS